MGLFDEEGSEDGGGLFGPPQPAGPPAATMSQPGAMGLFDADGEEDGGLFAADVPTKAAPQTEREIGSSMIVASLFATEDSDAGSVDFERLVGGGVVAIREAESDSGSDSGSDSESSATSAAEPAERRYRVVAEAGAIIREKFDLESEYVRTAEAGEVLESISTKVTDKGVVRVETAEGWVSQTTADGSTKLLHWLGAKEEPKPKPEPEPEPEPQTDLVTAFWDYLAPTHKAIAELEAKKLAGDFWTCEWCGCELEDSEGTMLGPSGPDTLCTMCGTRYESEWTCAWCKCSRNDTSQILPGPEDCKGGLCFGCGTRHKDEQAAAELEKQAAEAAQRKIAAEKREEMRRQAEVKRKADAEARAAQIAQEKVRAEEAEAERVALDAQTSRRKRYRVVNQAVVRLGFNINSPTADVNGGRGSLHIGEVIEVIEERVNDSGVKRICFEDGWVSERAANGVVLLEPGTEWWRVIAPAKIRTGWQLESPPPPPIFQQALSVGEVFEAREIRQDDPADEDDPDDNDVVEALHLRFAVNRWVSEIDPGNDGQFVLEKLSPEEQEQYATTARRAQEAADKAEAERVQAERLKAEAEARAKADAAAAAKEAAIAKAKAEAARIRQAEADGTEVGQWLRNLNLSMYTVAFKEQGYEELEVLKHVLESQVEALMQNVEMAVGHSFRFRDALSVLQAEDAESAQAVLDAEREFLINDATVKEAADLQASVAREKQAEELIALHVSARRAALDHAAEAQERADLAELKAYQDNLATQMQRKALSGDTAKREALEARFEQESALRKRVEAETALGTSRLRQVELELRTTETKLRVAAEQEKGLEKRRNEAISRRKADEIGRKMAENNVAELTPRVKRAEELAEAAARVAKSSMEAEKAARDSLDTARSRARLGPELLVRKLTEGALEARDLNADETAIVDVNAAEAEQRQAAAEEEIRIGQVEALLRAAARGDESRLVQLLADGADVNASDAVGDTALGLAAEHGHCECVGLLLANGAVFTQIPTSQWSYEQVDAWFCETFVWWVKYAHNLEAAQIDGEALIALDEGALRDDLGVVEADELTSTRRLLVAEEERSKLQELAHREEALRLEEEEVRLEAARQHELKSLELAWKGTVALAEERAEEAAREAAENELKKTTLAYTKGNHLRLSIRTPTGDVKRVDAWSGEPVSALKCTVQKITGIAPTQQALIFRFKELAPALPLGSYNIPDNSVLELKRVAGGGGRSNILLRTFAK